MRKRDAKRALKRLLARKPYRGYLIVGAFLLACTENYQIEVAAGQGDTLYYLSLFSLMHVYIGGVTLSRESAVVAIRMGASTHRFAKKDAESLANQLVELFSAASKASRPVAQYQEAINAATEMEASVSHTFPKQP
jgi:hypothetical protein